MLIKKYKKAILDALLPTACIYCNQPGPIICSSCLNKITILGKIEISVYSCQKIIYLFDYQQPEIKKAIHFFKYPPYQTEILKILFPLIKKFFQTERIFIEELKKNNFVLAPVPLFKRKKAQRGFNQSELFALKLAQEFNLFLKTDLLIKTKSTPSQTKLNPVQRKNNVKNIFKGKNKSFPRIVLIDDVLTTGATLTAAAKTLQKSGVKEIKAIILARD